MMTYSSVVLILLSALLAVLSPLGCAMEPDQSDLDYAASPRVRIMYNNTGSSASNGQDPEVDDILIAMIDRAQVSVDVATMGFSRQEVIDALVRAHERGVRVRFVGDGRHLEGFVDGYQTLEALNIPTAYGNMYHIMHDKFFVIDDRYVYTGTGNTTPTGFDRNDNNYVFIDSPDVATEFRDEFEQMLSGRFGSAKEVIDNGNTYQVGDTVIEVHWSPQ
ncbi:MAG: hypothetical protein KC561_09055, partial [Myxococcales bacterium]|nr:hypothetical protein [Myxococcales bacterium]